MVKTNTYLVELSSRDANDTTGLLDAAKRLAEEIGEPDIFEAIHEQLKRHRKTGDNIEAEVDSPSGEHHKIEINPTLNGGCEAIARRRTDEHKEKLELIASSEKKRLRKDQMLAFLGDDSSFFHEINNYAVVASGYSQFLSKVSKDPAEKEKLEMIVRAINSIKNVCETRMRLSRDPDEILKPIYVQTSVDRILSLVEMIYKLKGVEVQTYYADDLPKVNASEDLLYYLWFNLFKNAYEAVEEKEQPRIIKISVEPYFGKQPDFDFEVQVSVQDNGCGMDEETRRAWKTQDLTYFTKKSGGHGIGRQIIFDVINEHNKITEHNKNPRNVAYSIQSKPGEGTKFTVYFAGI